MRGDLLTPFQAFLWIAASTVLITGSTTAGWLLWRNAHHRQRTDPRYTVRQIAHHTPTGVLPLGALEEVLAIDSEQPVNLFAFDTSAATERLKSFPPIEGGRVHTFPPETVVCHYRLRRPVAKLKEVHNMAIDPHGVVFPLSPFLTPKRLPYIVVGLASPPPWGSQLKAGDYQLAFEVLRQGGERLEGIGWRLLEVDTSHAHSFQLGRRWLAVKIAPVDEGGEVTLLLTRQGFRGELANFCALVHTPLFQEWGRGEAHLLDFRLPQTAYVRRLRDG